MIMTREEFMMEASLKLLSSIDVEDIPRIVKRLTIGLFGTEEVKNNKDVPLFEVLRYVNPKYVRWFKEGFEEKQLNTVEDLIKFSPRDCLKFRNIGNKGLEDLNRVLIKRYGVENWLYI